MALTKCLLLMAVALAAYCIAAKPVEPEEVDFDAISKKLQEDAQRQFEEFKKQSQTFFPLPPLDVKQLPQDGKAHVYGETQQSFHVKSNINGKVTEQSGGRKVINDDGKITEYDTA